MDIFSEIIEMIKSGKIKDAKELHVAKIKLSSKYHLNKIPSNTEILENAAPEDVEKVREILKIKPMRTISGVAVVAIMTSPAKCPHGKCIYCPGGEEFQTPQSYTGKEPAAMRALQNKFDPYSQTVARIQQFEQIGHFADKIDLIVMGGTFTCRPPDYQENFIKGAFDGMNGVVSETLEKAHELNERAKHRCIGLTIETRPDWFRKGHADFALGLGATRVELGVQIVDDTVLEFVRRGHKVEDVVAATKVAKDAGLKVGYHIMPGLPLSNPAKDLASFRMVFENPDFRPDMLKLYPCLVLENTELYNLWKEGKYRPYSTEEAADVIARMKEIIPRYVRIQRVQRDIPAYLIVDGVKKSNLRQIVLEKMAVEGKKCNCIRCREIGHNMLKRRVGSQTIETNVLEYGASGGREFFISVDTDEDFLVGYARLRIPSPDAWRQEMEGGAGIIRELKVFGQSLALGRAPSSALQQQHRGFGKILIEKADQILRDNGIRKLLVTSGVGAREYYRKLGFERVGVYMGKKLS
ncbi:MAG: tRNA uridine(34) 5-carboxymethylaminomethyl modification radical SAM/GNAT enzyme Elp3 [Thermoplasmata archaeon]|nr:tRNA uridine(34) 5-carboxymethylaminomethyl modification radical SAM/GNAT enzyme Elp3 [Thermoplasmata archaeon]